MITKKSISDLGKSLDGLDEILTLKDEIKIFALGLKHGVITYNDIIGSDFYTHQGKGSIIDVNIKYGRTKKPEYRIVVSYYNGKAIYQFNPYRFENDRMDIILKLS